jgi:hypothetical protein
MSQTLAYVRVSTEDQVEFSPDAQAKRCRDLARLRDLGPVTVLADEGWSGKNLERPAMRKLLRLIEAGEVRHLLIWRWDRLSRDQGDFSRLVSLFGAHGVIVHSVNEGRPRPQFGVGQDAESESPGSSLSTTATKSWRTPRWASAKRPNEAGGRIIHADGLRHGEWRTGPTKREWRPLVQRIFTLRASKVRVTR